jgi:dienelactone hydrolase
MNGELVSTTTSDQVRVHGFLLNSAEPSGLPVDGVVVMHGLAGNFYSSPLLLNIASRLAAEGLSAVVGNSRGHDLLNWTIRSGRSQTIGSAVEDVAESTNDLNGWVEFLVRRGCKRILLVGHSLGAIKALFTLAHQPHPAIVAAAVLSPTRLNYSQFANSRSGHLFLDTMQRAESMAMDGRGTELMQIQFPFPTLMAAQAYLDKYGPGNRFDWFGFANQILTPTLILFGELELNENAAFEGIADELRAKLPQFESIEWKIVPRADHFYVACVGTVCDLLVNWLRSAPIISV